MQFLEITKRALKRHGINMDYTEVSTGAYDPETGKPAIVKTNHTLLMYPKQFIANQYNYPTLVGKESIMFYLTNDNLLFLPKANDEITYKLKKYKVQSVQEHFAEGSIALYKLVAVRG